MGRIPFAVLLRKLSITGMAKVTVRRPLDFWSSLQIELLTCYEGSPQIRGPAQGKSEYLSAWLIRSGWIDVEAGGTTTRAAAGWWMFPGPGHRVLAASNNLALLSIAFYAHTPMREPFLGNYSTLKVRAGSAADLEKHAVRLVRFVEKQFPGTAWNTFKELATFEQFASIRTRFTKWFEAWCEVMRKQGAWMPADQHIDPRVRASLDGVWKCPVGRLDHINQLPAKLGVSRDSLDRLMLRDTGRTLRQTLQLRLVEEARSLLRRNDMLVKQVAFSLGFKTLAHFSRWFKAHAGESPRIFRKRSLNG